MRGKRRLLVLLRPALRITPADAGKTVLRRTNRRKAPDHPRRCGENTVPPVGSAMLPGSPPQVRGKHLDSSFTASRDGITPAGAGKTIPSQCTAGVAEDHPRRCGENLFSSAIRFFSNGSPPQVRGKLQAAAGKAKERRITPAGAGKTLSRGGCGSDGRDHPRRCGENACHSSSKSNFTGSPPQVRGKRAAALVRRAGAGITPAGAGKTAAAVKKLALCQDHPRRCGENLRVFGLELFDDGSPPQVRGKQPQSFSNST